MPEMNTIFSRGNAQPRQRLLHLGQDRIIAAAGTPADFLIAGQIFRLSDVCRAVIVDMEETS